MTRAEREMLVERYLTLEMNAGQEQEFIMQAAVDGELRQILRASRLVDRALERNREAHPPAGHLDVRDRALALLAATPALTPPTPGKSMGRPDRSSRPLSWPALATTALLFTLAGFFSHDFLQPGATPSAVLWSAGAPGTLTPQTVPLGELHDRRARVIPQTQILPPLIRLPQ